MGQALASKVSDLTVFAKATPNSNNTGPSDVAGYYGIREHLNLKLIPFTRRASVLAYLWRLWRAPRADLVFGRYIYPVLLSALRGARVAYEVHAPATSYKKWFERWLMRRAELVTLVCITHALASHYQALYPNAPIVVLADAANDPVVTKPPREHGPLTAAYVGSWYAGRGIETVVELAQRFPDITFLAAGGSKEQLRTAGIDVPNNLQCLGYVAPVQTADILSSADILLAPYQREVRVAGNRGDTAAWSSPMKFFEYMAHGKAIICSDLEVFHEVFEHEETCLFVQADDITQWQAAITRLLQDRKLLCRLGERARTKFLAHHSWDTRADRLLCAVWPNG
jgi:glycosyltransferase involved in cell wall biosynthesis